MTILLIEDDMDDREFFRMALETYDSSIRLVAVENGIQALEKMNKDISFLPDYIFLDMNMPYLSGKECLGRLRLIERLKNVPVILYSTIRDFEELGNSHATSFVTKPNSIKELVKILAGIIK